MTRADTNADRAASTSHACDACGGSGDANDYRPACSNEAHGDGCGCGDAPLPCPICHGAGRISDVMPVADALADAETMLNFASTRFSTWADDAHVAWSSGGWVVYHLVHREDEKAASEASFAARTAFRAVPGLRGE